MWLCSLAWLELAYLARTIRATKTQVRQGGNAVAMTLSLRCAIIRGDVQVRLIVPIYQEEERGAFRISRAL